MRYDATIAYDLIKLDSPCAAFYLSLNLCMQGLIGLPMELC